MTLEAFDRFGGSRGVGGDLMMVTSATRMQLQHLAEALRLPRPLLFVWGGGIYRERPPVPEALGEGCVQGSGSPR